MFRAGLPQVDTIYVVLSQKVEQQFCYSKPSLFGYAIRNKNDPKYAHHVRGQTHVQPLSVNYIRIRILQYDWPVLQITCTSRRKWTAVTGTALR